MITWTLESSGVYSKVNLCSTVCRSNFFKLSIPDLEGVDSGKVQIFHLVASPEQTLDDGATTVVRVGK